MRLNGQSEVLHKMHTANHLSYEKMEELKNRDLIDFYERNRHDDFFLGVEELFMLLPELITIEGKTYAFRMWKSAFDVPYVGFVSASDMFETPLIAIGGDDLVCRDMRNKYADLVDMFYELIIWLDNNYRFVFKEYREKLQHCIAYMQ